MRPDLDAVRRAFDARAAQYPHNVWHQAVAERLVALCGLAEGDGVLDAATGTGFAALAAARAVGSAGRVIGVDVSSEMLREARKSGTAARATCVEWREGDATRLPADWSGAFDVVICAAGLLYMDPDEALAEWRRVLKPAGRVAFTSMCAGSPPAGALFRQLAAEYGVRLSDPSTALGSEAACREVLARAGFHEVEVLTESVTLSTSDHALAWESNVGSAGHAAVKELSATTMDELRVRYLDALARECRESPERFSTAGVLYAFGRQE